MIATLPARLLSRLAPLVLTMAVVTGCGLSQASPVCPASSTPTTEPQQPVDPQPVLDCLHSTDRPDSAVAAGISTTQAPTASGGPPSFPPPHCRLVRMDGKTPG